MSGLFSQGDNSPRDSIVQLDDEALRNLKYELGRAFNQQATVLNELRARLDAVKLEEQRRKTATATGLHISDHAVLRYLERVKGVDMAAVREEIAALADETRRADSRDRYARRRSPTSNLIFGLNEADGTVTTVFTDAEDAIMDVQDFVPVAQPDRASDF